MSYYWMIPSTTKETVGRASSQIKGMKAGYDLYEENSIWNIPSFERVSLIPNLDAFVINPGAHVTEVIFCDMTAAPGFLLNDKVKEILASHRLPNHAYYPAKIIHKEKEFSNYYWIQFEEDSMDCFIYEESLFEQRCSVYWREWEVEKKDLRFKSAEEARKYITQQEYDRVLFPQNAIVRDNLDFMTLRKTGYKQMLSERLVSAFIDAKIRGMDFEKVEGLTSKKS